MAYAKSIDVRVYPTAWRGANTVTEKTFNPEASLNTEENLANLSNRLAKLVSGAARLDSYVVSCAGNKAIIVLHGYIFEVSNLSNLGSPLWAKIQVLEAATTYKGREFSNPTLACFDNGTPNPAVAVLDIKDGAGVADSDYYFHGLQFSDTEVSGDADHGVYVLQILDSEGHVPAKSWLMVDTTQVQDTTGIPLAQTLHTSSVYASSVSATTVRATNVYASTVSAPSMYASMVSTATVSATNVYASSVSAASGSFTDIQGSTIYASNIKANVFDLGEGSWTFVELYPSNSSNIHLNISSSANFKIWASNIYANMKYASITMHGADISMSGAYITATSDIYAAASGQFQLFASPILLTGDVTTLDIHASNVYAASVSTSVVSSAGNLNISASNYFNLYVSKTSSVYAGYEIDMENSGGTNIYDNGSGRTITLTASNVSLVASSINLNATSVTLGATAAKTKLTTNSVGNSTTPIYLSAGTPKACSLPEIKSGDVFMGYDSNLLSGTTNVGMTAFVSSGTGDITSSSNTWQSLNNMSDGSICLEYILIGDILKISMRLRDWKALVGGINSSGRGLRFKWDWLVKQTLGDSYSARVDGESYWHNSIVASIDTKDYSNATNNQGSITTHIGWGSDTAQYVYIWQNLPTPTGIDILGVNAEISMRVKKN